MFEHIRKLVLSASVIVLFALYSLQHHRHSANDPAIAALVATVTPARTVPTVVIAPTKTPPALGQARNRPPAVPADAGDSTAAIPTATATAIPSGTYRDGTYSGDAADANWGDVQVEVEISGGQISNVNFLEFPNHRNRSKEINNHAMPLLTQEAIAAQSAEVDIVTGATDTSEAFIESLDSALQQAGA